MLHVPLRLQGRCIGVLTLHSTHQNVTPPHVPEYLQVLGGYAGVAIDFARKYEPLQREMAVARPLAMMGTMLSGFEHEMRNRINGLYAIHIRTLDGIDGGQARAQRRARYDRGDGLINQTGGQS